MDKSIDLSPRLNPSTITNNQAEYFHGERRAQKQEGAPVLNVISLEVSSSPLGQGGMLQAPGACVLVCWCVCVGR
jgi:hypothetical protein